MAVFRSRCHSRKRRLRSSFDIINSRAIKRLHGQSGIGRQLSELRGLMFVQVAGEVLCSLPARQHVRFPFEDRTGLRLMPDSKLGLSLR